MKAIALSDPWLASLEPALVDDVGRMLSIRASELDLDAELAGVVERLNERMGDRRRSVTSVGRAAPGAVVNLNLLPTRATCAFDTCSSGALDFTFRRVESGFKGEI